MLHLVHAQMEHLLIVQTILVHNAQQDALNVHHKLIVQFVIQGLDTDYRVLPALYVHWAVRHAFKMMSLNVLLVKAQSIYFLIPATLLVQQEITMVQTSNV